jgi:small conductance mechanosensitive channel
MEGRMKFLTHISDALADDRLGVNLIAIHGVITVVVLLSLLIRRLVIHGSTKIAKWTGLRWLEAAGDEAARHARRILFWLTVLVLFLVVAGGAAYHFLGRDIRLDLADWYTRLTPKQLLQIAVTAGLLLGVFVAAWCTIRAVRQLWPAFQSRACNLVAGAGNEEIVARLFGWLHVYAVVTIRLAAGWALCKVAELGSLASTFVFLLRVSSILMLGYSLTLSFRLLMRTLAPVGERYLGKRPFQRYWERVARLLPFGELCFDAAVYVVTAALCAHELSFDPKYGFRVVLCIGIFFITRALIELTQVLLGEAFGLYAESESADQKRQTLVPLLCSVSQYVLYVGSALVMLGVLGVDTTPILAGAGILGLAVGLGAQTMVADLVSGFFILFENQFLVGDYVQVGDAAGTVEAVGIRVTHIRDGQGKLHIIPNGQIKGVVSFSKGYVNAVVDLRVPAGTDLEGTFRAMTEAGRRLRQSHKEVLADTQIQGLVDLGTSEMTVRAVTKVRPGTHGMMQNEYRRLLKQVLDQNAAAAKPAQLAA